PPSATPCGSRTPRRNPRRSKKASPSWRVSCARAGPRPAATPVRTETWPAGGAPLAPVAAEHQLLAAQLAHVGRAPDGQAARPVAADVLGPLPLRRQEARQRVRAVGRREGARGIAVREEKQQR